jgi:hypothetical protein
MMTTKEDSMRSRERLSRLLVAAAITAGLTLATGTALAANAHLFGPSILQISKDFDPKLTYRATGLRPATGYALRLVRPKTAGRLRCVAYLAAPRRASGTEYFHGSVPSATNCVGSTTVTQRPLGRGPYELEVCVPVSTFGACRSTDSVVRRAIRLE